MARSETELEMVMRHVREGERRVANQRELVRYLRERGYHVAVAETLLASFEDAQIQHQEHLARLQSADGAAFDEPATDLSY